MFYSLEHHLLGLSGLLFNQYFRPDALGLIARYFGLGNWRRYWLLWLGFHLLIGAFLVFFTCALLILLHRVFHNLFDWLDVV